MENIKQQLVNIALENLVSLEGRGDLEAHNSDSEDFVEVSVWELERVLHLAYELGKNSKG